MNIREEIKNYLERTGTPPARLADEAGRAAATLHKFMTGERSDMMEGTANDFRAAMKRHPKGIERKRKCATRGAGA